MNYHAAIMEEVEQLLLCNGPFELDLVEDTPKTTVYALGDWIKVLFAANRIVILGVGSNASPNGYISDLGYGEAWFAAATRETTYLYGKFIRFRDKREVGDAAWIIAVQRLFADALARKKKAEVAP